MAEPKPKKEKEDKLEAEAVEPKKAPRRRRKAEKDEKLAAESVTPETEAVEKPDAEDELEPEADDAQEEKGEDQPKRRRGSAQTAAGQEKKAPAPRSPDGDIVVRASARFVRCAPRKARLVVDHIRGKDVDQARAILTHTPRAASRDVLRLLESAIANAENNHELVADELRVKQVLVNEGPTLKRYRPRALGRATQIKKRTSHMSITLSPKE